jgi:hypothetical protein
MSPRHRPLRALFLLATSAEEKLPKQSLRFTLMQGNEAC